MFISLEGPEGSGKSTQAQLLASHLAGRGVKTLLTREPGGTALGDRLRELLMDSRVALTPRAETLLFCAARAQLLAEVVRPGLARGLVVICDRYADSTLAYQSFGRGLELTAVESVVTFATEGLRPDISVLLDLPPSDGLLRKLGGADDRFERETLAFHRRVREGYLTLVRAEPDRWLVVDASQKPEVVAQHILQRLSGSIGQ
ncbi:MAG: dTMP kinase [Chloroflexi bacterium]|nr:dTMP kinase [Chloroflexota bacterium]MCL5108144.1 dTMP kinase [Chloroflexota bacterium]